MPFLLALALLLPTDWMTLFPTLEAHIPRVEIQTGDSKGICSSVVFDVDAEGMASALTAGHCVEHEPTSKFDLTLNDRHATVVAVNRLLDLAIVRFRAHKEKAIVMASESPLTGAEVAIVGYAFGVEELVAQFGRVAQTRNRETKAMWINVDLIFGDSGGPVIDGDGRLVGISSRIYSGGQSGQMAHLGAAVRIEAIRDFVDDYKDRLKKEKK